MITMVGQESGWKRKKKKRRGDDADDKEEMEGRGAYVHDFIIVISEERNSRSLLASTTGTT